MDVGDSLYVPAALSPSRSLSIHSTGSCVCPTGIMDVVEICGMNGGRFNYPFSLAHFAKAAAGGLGFR